MSPPGADAPPLQMGGAFSIWPPPRPLLCALKLCCLLHSGLAPACTESFTAPSPKCPPFKEKGLEAVPAQVCLALYDHQEAPVARGLTGGQGCSAQGGRDPCSRVAQAQGPRTGPCCSVYWDSFWHLSFLRLLGSKDPGPRSRRGIASSAKLGALGSLLLGFFLRVQSPRSHSAGLLVRTQCRADSPVGTGRLPKRP